MVSSLIHALAYSFVGAQTLYLATNWNPIYWNTACLVINSGSLNNEDSTSTDYGKMAKALNESINAGISISLVDINESNFGFKPDAKNNLILFGMKAILNINDDLVNKIIANRPYYSIQDFYQKVKPNRAAMISLIKAGAFDKMLDRKKAMVWFIWETCDKKSRLTLQNFSTLIKQDLLDLSTEERQKAFKIYEFNRYLKTLPKNPDSYKLDVRSIEFLINMDKSSLILYNETMNIRAWDKFYQSTMDVFRNWLSQNSQDILQELNFRIFKADWDKYVPKANISAWEMEVLCFYYHPHELIKVNKDKYGLTDFDKIPEEPIVERSFTKSGKTINLFKLFRICGTCIAKNKTKSIITILTTSGVVNVKFRKEYFALFDKRISELGNDGVKHVIEKSWFDRGNMIVVQGIRSGDSFITKKYNSSTGHQLYRITNIEDNGDLILQTERYKGELEDND